MPGIGESYSLAAAQAIDTAIRLQFPEPDKLKDAQRIHELMGKAGIWEDLMLENAYAALRLTVWAMALAACFVPPYVVWGALILYLERTEHTWERKRRVLARAEYEGLLRTDPKWRPIAETIKEIIQVHGTTKHLFGGTKDVVELKN